MQDLNGVRIIPLLVPPKEAYGQLTRNTTGHCHSGFLYTFSDPALDPVISPQAADLGATESLPISSFYDDLDMQNLVSALLFKCIRKHTTKMDLVYDKDHDRFYFSARDMQGDLKTASWYSIRTNRATTRQAVKKYTYGKNEFFRHTAVKIRPVLLGERWHLQLTPGYHFTQDGQRPWDPERTTEYATKQMAREMNQHVLNTILFWSHKLSLSRSNEHIPLELGPHQTALISREPIKFNADFGILGDTSIQEDRGRSSQVSLFHNTEVGDDE